ncbi:MAG: PEP-CTERM sorting domain-containing protein [Verrucomicrobiaceae bacterium]|nr:PEP-CTERM sorting domain-containing protein [Verrucomicrobiaceae bacterium]
MKKLILTITAFLCATFAFAEAESKLFYLSNATGTTYRPYFKEDSSQGTWGGGQGANLGNYDYLANDTFIDLNVWEFATSGISFDQVDSIEFTITGTTFANSGATLVDADLEAFKIGVFAGGTGDAKGDWKTLLANLVADSEYVSLNDMKDGVLLENLNWDISGEEYITFAIMTDSNVLAPVFGNESAEGGSLGFSSSATLNVTAAAVPEPSTYAMIFGAIALGFVAYRRRK